MPVPMALASRAKMEPRMAPGWMGPKARLRKPFLVEVIDVESEEMIV